MVDVDAMCAQSEEAMVRAELARSRSDAAGARLQEQAARLQRSRAARRRRGAGTRRSTAPRTRSVRAQRGLEWRLTRSPNATVVRLSGELDLASEHALEALRVELLATAPARVVVDLRELQFVELTGLHWLMALHEGLAGRSRLELVRGPDCVHAALRLTGVDERFMFVAGDDID